MTREPDGGVSGRRSGPASPARRNARDLRTVGGVTPRLLPLFPLGTVLLPGAPLPLRIFEPRYRRLVTDLLVLPAEQRRFGVLAIREGREVGMDGVKDLYDVGCVAMCTEIEAAGDGTFELRSVGTSRFRVIAFDRELPYLRGEVEPLPEPVGKVGGLPQLVGARYSSYRAALAELSGSELTLPALPDDPRLLSYLVAATVLSDLPDRQSLLAEPDAAERLAAEARWLARECQLVRSLSAVPASQLLHTPYSLS